MRRPERRWARWAARAIGLALIAHMTAVAAGADPEHPTTNPFAGDQAAIKEGRSWFLAVCSNCHGPSADGRGRGQASDLRVFDKGFAKFLETVRNGREVPGRLQKMPAWGGVLSDDVIYKIGAYLQTLAIEGANWGDGRR